MKKDKAISARIAEVETRLGVRSFNSLKASVFKDNNVQGIVFSAIDAAKKDLKGALTDVESQTRTLLDMRYAHLAPEVRGLLAAEAKSEVRMKRGLNNENKILNTYEVDHKVEVTERNTKNLNMDFGTFKLTGRTDGWVAAHNRIVDSKDRTRFFPEVPIYDEIQLRVYMKMTGATESELIENFPDGTKRVTKFMNDTEKWDLIEKCLRDAAQRMNDILADDSQLEALIGKNTVNAG
jgi:5-hydroxyisourate hydrolase-like protein (transthyretin family)